MDAHIKPILASHNMSVSGEKMMTTYELEQELPLNYSQLFIGHNAATSIKLADLKSIELFAKFFLI